MAFGILVGGLIGPPLPQWRPPLTSRAAPRTPDGPANALFNAFYYITWCRAPTDARTRPVTIFSRIGMAL